MVRLGVARLHFCSNSFNPVRTGLDDMRAHEWRGGEAALAAAPAGSELHGLATFCAARPDWHVDVLRAASAPPGGPLQAEVFGAWLAEVEAGLRAGRFDAVYLSLHGACQAEGDPTADLTILRRVRSVVGRTPVMASFHWAANLSEETALLLDGATGVGPAGAAAAAMRVLGLLEGLLAGRIRPVGALVRLPSLLPSLGAPLVLPDVWRGTGAAAGALLDASAFGGFPWADSRLAGGAALAWADRDSALARGAATRLAHLLAAAPLLPATWQPQAALRAGLASRTQCALLDPADDPQVGGIADTPGLLAVLSQADLPGPAAFGVLHDPAVTVAAQAAGVGATLARDLGARLTGDYGPPVPVRATVERLAEAPWGGPLAVLRLGALAVLVAGHRPAAIGATSLAAAGIDPGGLRLLALKSGALPDPWLAETFAEVLTCACPGPASPDLARLPYQYVAPVRRTC